MTTIQETKYFTGGFINKAMFDMGVYLHDIDLCLRKPKSMKIEAMIENKYLPASFKEFYDNKLKPQNKQSNERFITEIFNIANNMKDIPLYLFVYVPYKDNDTMHETEDFEKMVKMEVLAIPYNDKAREKLNKCELILLTRNSDIEGNFTSFCKYITNMVEEFPMINKFSSRMQAAKEIANEKCLSLYDEHKKFLTEKGYNV